MNAALRRWLYVAVMVATAGVGAACAGASDGFPPSIYPPAVHGRGAVSPCPNPAALDPFTPSVTSAAVESAKRFLNVSETLDLHDSDRAWWPQVRALWRRREPAANGFANDIVDGSEPLGRSGYAVIARFSCGESLVSKSLQVTVGPRHMRCAACRSQLWFVDRLRHALLYYVY